MTTNPMCQLCGVKESVKCCAGCKLKFCAECDALHLLKGGCKGGD